MTRRFGWTLLLAVAGLLGSLPARSATEQPWLMWCQRCTTQQQAAIAALAPAGITLYFGDTSRNQVHAWLVRQIPAGTDAATRGERVLPVLPSPGYRDAILAAMRYYNADPIGWQKTLTRTVDARLLGRDTVPTSVYAVVGAGRSQSALIAALQARAADSGLVQLAARVQRELAGFHGVNLLPAPHLEVRLSFADGSRVDALVDAATARWALDPLSARDAVGNAVPYVDNDGKIRGLGGQFIFAQDGAGDAARQAFLQRLARLRVPVDEVGEARAKSGAGDWRCLWRQRDRFKYSCFRRTGA